MEHGAERAKCKEVVGKGKHHRQWHTPQELGYNAPDVRISFFFVVSRLACTTVVHISISNDHTSHQRPHVLLGHGIVELMSRCCTKVCLLVCSPQELCEVEKRGRNPDRSSSFTAGAETLEVCSMQSVSRTLRHHSRQVQSRWRCAACSLSAELYANPISMHNGASAACSPSFCLQGMGSKLLHVSTAKNTRGEAEGPA